MHKHIVQTIQRLWNRLTAWTATLRLPKQTEQTKDDTPALTLKRGVLYKGLLAMAAVVLAVVMLFTMTAAWYKNVVQTSGLLFQVDQWGLDSSVSVQDELIGAKPGDSGQIQMSVENTSNGIISVNLGVSKGDFYNDLADMRKRLFFYIDDMAYRGGEHTPRVYLNSMETYSYTVLPEHNLVLGENGNASPLMWEWVFDVVGYYFLGTVTTESKAVVSEYLRPVEYTLDHATFHNGVLTTVDGTTTPAAFVAALSEDDGYEGTVTTTVTAVDGRVYYPVAVDDAGQGVWIYLCNLGEIEYETMVDTRLGAAEADTARQFETYLHVTAQQKQLTVVEAATEEQLLAALNDNENDMVQLTGDVTLTALLAVRSTHEKILDLNGHTIRSNRSYSLVAYADTSLTVMNGFIHGESSSATYGVSTIGGDVALSNVTITGFGHAVTVMDTSSAYNDSRVLIKGCTFRGTTSCVYALGNGSKTEALTCVVIEDSLMETTGGYALLGNGNDTSAGTDVRVFNTTMRGPYSAVYHPQHSSYLYMQGCTLEATTPMAIKSGDIKIVDCILTAMTGPGYDENVDEPAMVNSGFSCNGAGVSVETNYTHPCSVTISGDNTIITSTYQPAVLKYAADNPLFVITVTGGKYSHDISTFLPDGYRCVKDGDYYVVQETE